MTTDTTGEVFPPSPQQRYAWLTQVASTGGGLCPTISCEIEVRGPIDQSRLQSALDALVRRYEILRTDHQRVPGFDVPLQRISAAAVVPVDVVTKEAWRSSLSLPVDPAGPPLQVGLARRSDELHTLFLRLPVLNADATSMVLLARALGGLYGGAAGATEDDDPLQYADLAEWLNQRLGEADVESRQHWDAVAQGFVGRPALPLSYTRAAARPQGVDTVEVLLGDGLPKVAERDGSSVRDLLLASWAALLSRYAPGRPLVVMTSRTGRQEAGVAEAIGPLARHVPLRFDTDPSTTLRSVLHAVRAQDDAAERSLHAFSPEAWLTGGSADQAPAPIGFSHRLAPDSVRVDGVEFALSRVDTVLETALELAVEQGDASLRVLLRYRTDTFDRADVVALAAGLGPVLETWRSAPDTPVCEVPLLPSDDRRAVAGAVAGGRAPVPVHVRFAEQARAEPSAIAVVDGCGRHSYGALHATVRELAEQLGERGVGGGALVGILFGRSAGALAAMLAVLESGAAYVPLDPTLPLERLRLMVDDARVEVVITEPDHAALAESLCRTPLVLRDVRRDAGPVLIKEQPDGAGDRAYVLYTSGTTGRPKGVSVGHEQIARYVDGITGLLGTTAGLSYAHVSALTADLGYTVLFASLCTGGTLHLVADDVLRSGDELAAYFRREAVDVAKITPSHLTALLQTSADPAGLVPRRALVLGGELLRLELAARLDKLADGCDIYNHYGPTEATVGTTAYRLSAEDLDPRSTSVPIGSPLGAATVHVVDQVLHEVPHWVPGELLIGGPGVSDGYLGLPELTAERFLEDPLATGRNDRCYRTGDQVRRLPSGDLEFLGRDDDQVKIAGYRVELGEIESVLRTHPDVNDCVALVRSGDAGHDELVAFVTGAEDLPGTELQQFAEARLPSYMRPAAVLALDTLPLTGNGKLDRTALARAASDVRQAVHRSDVPPRDATELLLSHLWTRSLGRTVGVTDDFFDVGGNSLKAIRLIASIRKATGISLPVSAMVNASTIEAMAEFLRTEEREDQFRSTVPLQASGSLEPFFCVHAGGGGVLGYLALARAVGDERPFIGLQSAGLYPGGRSCDELTGMAAQYVEDMKRQQPQGPYWLGGWSLGGIIAHEVARQLAVAGDEVAQLVLFDSDAPFEAPQVGLGADDSLDPHAEVTDIELIQGFAWHYQLEVPSSELESLDAPARLDHLVALVRSRDLLPPDAGRVEMQQLLTVYRANVTAATRYVRETTRPITPSADYPVTLFVARDETLRDSKDEALGWAQFYGPGVRVEQVPGNHYTMMVPPQVGVLAERLAALLRRTGSTGEPVDGGRA